MVPHQVAIVERRLGPAMRSLTTLNAGKLFSLTRVLRTKQWLFRLRRFGGQQQEFNADSISGANIFGKFWNIFPGDDKFYEEVTDTEGNVVDTSTT